MHIYSRVNIYGYCDLFVMAKPETMYLAIKKALIKKQNHIYTVKFYGAILKNEKKNLYMLTWHSS
jgi:hypothetical protein